MNILQITRIRKIAIETFKILNNLSPSYILDLVKFKLQITISDTKILLSFLE